MHLARLFGSALWRWLALAPVFCIISCSNGPGGDKLYPVTGKVLYMDQAAVGAVVSFHPKHAKNELTVQRPVGQVKDDGTFALTTGKDAGAPAGDYDVSVTWWEPV